MKTKRNLIGALALILLGVGALPAGVGAVNVADVEALEAAVAEANAGGDDKEIVLTSPAPDYQYQLTQPLVITESGITIRGAYSIRPDLLQILGVPAPEECPQNQVQDWQFETPGNPPWNQDPTGLIVEDEDRAYSPDRFAEFAGETGIDSAVLEQSVIVPEGHQILEQTVTLPVIPLPGTRLTIERVYQTLPENDGEQYQVQFYYKVPEWGGDTNDTMILIAYNNVLGIFNPLFIPITGVVNDYQLATLVFTLPGNIDINIIFMAALYNPLPGNDPTRILVDDVRLVLSGEPAVDLFPPGTGSFDSTAGWVQSHGHIITEIGPEAHSPDWAAQFVRPVAWLHFDLWIPEAGPASDRLLVSGANDIPLGEYSADDDTYRAGYVQVPPINLETSAGSDFTLRFRSEIERGSQSIFLVDNVRIRSPRMTDNLLINGDFDNGDDGSWHQTDLSGVPVIVPGTAEHPASPESPFWLARFGDVGPASLVFWTRTLQSSGLEADRLDLFLVDPVIDPDPEAAWSVTGLDSPGDWEVETIPLDPFAGTGRPVTIRFQSTLARLPDDERSIFLIDDVCAGALDDESCLGNLLGDPGFDWDDGSWTEIPADPKIIRLPDDEARSDPGVARFEGPDPDVKSLWQNINIDPESDRLRFYLKVEEWNEVAGADRFTVLIDNSPVLEVIPTAPDDDYIEYRVNISDYADDANHELRFESSTTRVPDLRTVFLLDDVCLPIAGVGQTPVIEVAEDVSFTLEGVSLIGGSAGLRALEGSEVTLRRCYIHGVSGPGVDLVRVAGAKIGHSVVFDCVTAGLQSSGSLLDALQCTLIGNREGVKITGGKGNVVACLVYGNNTGLLNTGGDEASAVGSLVQPVSVNGFTFDTEDTTPHSGNLGGEFFAPGPWVGKLILPIGSSVLTHDIEGLGGLDFEREIRGDSLLQVGADEVGGLTMQGWVNCIVDPLILYDAKRIVPGRTFTVRAYVENMDLSSARMIVKPQELTVDELYQMNLAGIAPPFEAFPGGPVDLFIDETDFSLRATFSINNSFVPHPLDPGRQLCLEGRATVYLWLNGELYGIGTYDPPRELEPYMFPAARLGSQFILDITPPVFNESVNPIDQPLMNWFSYHNDAVTPPPAYDFPYVTGWGPNINNPAVSYGHLGAGNAHVFFNPDSANVYETPTDGLTFTISAAFVDLPPRGADGNLRPIETSGFRTSEPLNSATSLLTQSQVLFNRIQDEDGRTITGRARLVNKGSTANIDQAGVVTQATLTRVTESDLAAQWLVQTPPWTTLDSNWRLAVSFEPTDLASNTRELGEPMNIWWLTYTRARLLSPPSGQEISAPEFTWDLDRQGAVPSNADPCFPIATFRLWQLNPGVQWEAVTGWSPWTKERVLGSFTRMDTQGSLLGDLLDAPGLAGKTLMISVVGADEAGNVQAPWPLTDTLPSEILLDNAGIAYGIWRNVGVLGRALDTQVQARFWLNRTDPPNRIRDTGEIDYGSSTRIPLPPEGNQRIEAAFDITMITPDIYGPNDVQAQWELYEDQRLLDQGTIPSTDFYTVRLVIPYDSDRILMLGDNKNRQRDVEYRFVARTQIRNDGISDTTPASVQFTVYASEDPGDEQPVKETTR